MSGPLIVQSDRTVLLEVAHPEADEARHELAVFAELERAPEHVHTYRITRLGLWNARAAGHTAEQMLATLDRYAKFPVPQTVSIDITDVVGDAGTTTLGPPKGMLGNSKLLGVFPLGCDICVARQSPPCGMKPGTDGCKGGTQSNPDVPCQFQGATKSGGSKIRVSLLPTSN